MALKGIRNGKYCLELVVDLLEKYWINIYPLLDSDDEEPFRERLVPFDTLFDRNGVLVRTIKEKKLSNSKIYKNITWYDIEKLKKDERIKDINVFYNAVQDSEKDYIENLKNDLNFILEQVKKINSFVNGKIGEGENFLKTDEIIGLLESMVKEIDKGLVFISEGKNEISDNPRAKNIDDSSLGKTIVARNVVIKSSSDILELLRHMIKWYELNRSASPVPYILKRAEGLVDKGFVDIIRDIAGSAMSEVGIVLGQNAVLNPTENYDSFENNMNYSEMQKPMEAPGMQSSMEPPGMQRSMEPPGMQRLMEPPGM